MFASLPGAQRANAFLDAFPEFRHKAVVDDWITDVVDPEKVARPALLEKNLPDKVDSANCSEIAEYTVSAWTCSCLFLASDDVGFGCFMCSCEASLLC